MTTTPTNRPPSPAIWDPRYPDPDILRDEVEAMIEAFVSSFLTGFPEGAVDGIYAKGSAIRRWDSPLDYVPELSDIDFHVLFADGRPENEKEFDLETSLKIQRKVDEGFAFRVPEPIHVPRVQMIPIKFLQQKEDFVPAPGETVRVLFGSKLTEHPVDAEKSTASALNLVLEDADYLRKLGDQVVDKPGRHKWEILRPLAWRVSPAGLRVLEILGVPFQTTWASNRTKVAALLRSIGENDLADNYSAFYLHAWDYFLSGYTDFDAARNIIRAGARVLERSRVLAQQKSRD